MNNYLFYFLIIFLFQTSAFGDTSIEKFNNELKLINEKISSFQKMNTSKSVIIEFLKKKTNESITNNNEYPLFVIIYYIHIAEDNNIKFLSELCKKSFDSVIKINNNTRLLSKIFINNISYYDPSIKILVLKTVDTILEVKPDTRELFSDLLIKLSNDVDYDIFELANSISQKTLYSSTFFKFLQWGKTSIDKRNKDKMPYFSCDFNLYGNKNSSLDCYYNLKSKFDEFIKKYYKISVIENNSLKGWDNIIYLAKPKTKGYFKFKFRYESEITPNEMMGYSKIYIIE